MKIKILFSFFAVLFLALGTFAADKLAIAEPVSKGGVKAEDIEAFWGILESSVKSDEYKLISRGALKQIMTEIGLTTSSDLMNLNSTQKAKLGQLETVKYILVSEIGKFGSRLNCTMRILDCSTGEIDQARTSNLRIKDLDELADKIEATLEKLLSDEKKLMRSAVLAPVVTYKFMPKTKIRNGWVASFDPAEIPNNFNVRLQSALISNNIQLQNLESIAKILKKNNLDSIFELEPKMYKKVGQLLEVQFLIQVFITRFEISGIEYNVSETGAKGFRYIGNIEGFVKVISAHDGLTKAQIPFDSRVNFRKLDRQETRDWTIDDYGKHMIKTVIPEKILPELLKVSELKAK